MSNKSFLKKLFKSYYQTRANEIPEVSHLTQREFGFIPWEKAIMIRHMDFDNVNKLRSYLAQESPMHTYSSGAVYDTPGRQNMETMGYRSCDLIIDIDVDHFYTPCKDLHDLWECKECGKMGTGMIEKCPSCDKLKISRLTWICDKCLEAAKNEVKKLIYDFLIPDFGINSDTISIAFSGHRGYHVKVEEEKIKLLASDQRREIVEYLTGQNLSFEILGLREKSGTIYGLNKLEFGWSRKILNRLEQLLSLTNEELKTHLKSTRFYDLSDTLITSLVNNKEQFMGTIESKDRNIWAIEGFGINSWRKFLKGVAREVGAEIDEPVTIDIHRLIRYPGSLHGKTGFKVQELTLDQIDQFNPLDEKDKKLDPIVFTGKTQVNQMVKITDTQVPKMKIKGELYGPYYKDERVDLPHYYAVFLLCKGVAQLI
jgi:DNA primase small subunit